MTVGRRQYNEAEMMQMQREAEARVREMQNRARKAAEEMGTAELPPPANRNWSTNPGMRRPRGFGRPQQQPRQGQNQHPQGQHNPAANQGRSQAPHQPNRPEEPPKDPPRGEPHDPAAHLQPPEKKDGTIIGDIMDALGLDEDYLLIIGLLLILINQRADTTLILALAYLLI